MPTPLPVEPEMQRIIGEISDRGDFPAAARVIERLRMTVGRENCAALDVARIILGDPGTASKVLRLVNSAFYRKDGPPISTITRAVVVMGFQAIRDLTTGVLLMEELLRHGRNNAVVRDGLRRSLLCGLLARRLAPHAAYPHAEEAYLLGLFADFGLLWLATYYRPEFERVLAIVAARQVPLAAAVREVLGADPETLSAAIVERWGFPAAFSAHFGHVPAQSAAEVVDPTARLSGIVGLAAEYAHALEQGSEAAPVLARCERLFGLRAEQVVAAAQAANAAMEEQALVLGLGAPRRPRSVAPARPTVPGEPGREPAGSGVSGRRDAGETLGLVSEITRSIVEQRDINEVLLMVLEGVARTGGFDVVFLTLLTRDRDRLVGRLGYGDGVDEFLAHMAVPVHPGAGVLADTVLERTARVMPAGSAAELVGAGTACVTIQSFITCPLVVRGKCVGALVAARTLPPPVRDADLPTVELFCNQAAVALHQYAR
jgi:HD-like signal output (HDOD) protein